MGDWIRATLMLALLLSAASLAPGAGLAQGRNEFFVGEPPYQMYVQYWPPAAGAPARPYPLVLVHGATDTGVVWTTTPDGRPGWAGYFAERGWPVYVVDWPGVGRSGFPPDFLTMGSAPIVDALVALLERIGPSAVMGHSMGGPMAYLLAERVPEQVRALIALTPSSPANTSPVRPAVPMDAPVYLSREDVIALNISDRFPEALAGEYYRMTVPLSPSIMNAARGHNNDWWIDRPEVVRSVPILFVAAEQDHTVTRDRTEPAAAFLGVPHTLVGADWGLPGHGHMLMMEEGHLAVAERIAAWLEAGPTAAR